MEEYQVGQCKNIFYKRAFFVTVLIPMLAQEQRFNLGF